MADPRDYKLDVSSLPREPNAEPPPAAGRPFLNVHFRCCNIYLKVYRAADGSCYRARCPRCGKGVRFEVGQEGSASRFFVVD